MDRLERTELRPAFQSVPPESEPSPLFAIEVENQTLIAHSTLLRLHSPYFEAALGRGYAESHSGRVAIRGHSAAEIGWLIKAFYTGAVPREADPLQLHDVADYYGVDWLMARCEEAFIDTYHTTISTDQKYETARFPLLAFLEIALQNRDKLPRVWATACAVTRNRHLDLLNDKHWVELTQVYGSDLCLSMILPKHPPDYPPSPEPPTLVHLTCQAPKKR